MEYDDEHHLKLIEVIAKARVETDKFLVLKPLSAGEIITPVNLDEMKKAYDYLNKATKDLWDYLNKFIGEDGKIHI